MMAFCAVGLTYVSQAKLRNLHTVSVILYLRCCGQRSDDDDDDDDDFPLLDIAILIHKDYTTC